ncbi:MAG: helicase-related protein, partial [Terriglobales bacterium]
APTQILAEQHCMFARERLAGYRVELVTSAQRRRGPAAAAAGANAGPQLAIGTQALLEGAMQFSRLGLVIVDEQHRFGVLQRFHLMHKRGAAAALAPHLLVMTATPIPRTLALTLYGDLDTSLLRHSPPGGLPISTRVVPQARANAVYEFVRARVAGGRQAYFVYPIIEETSALDLKPAELMFERLRALFPEFRVGLLHGGLRAPQKQAVMASFRRGELQVLVATTVIEVGVDVPNATLMVIEHAERFGMAQLHQLRGRVGRPQPAPARPSDRSYCFLLHGEPCGATARQRLQALARTRDGFELAELDLKLRGPGEFFGTRQSGMPMLSVAQPLRDQDLMETARQEARAYLDEADLDQQRLLIARIQQRWQRRYGLVEAG